MVLQSGFGPKGSALWVLRLGSASGEPMGCSTFRPIEWATDFGAGGVTGSGCAV